MMLSVAKRLALSIAEVMASISSCVGGSGGRTRVTGMGALASSGHKYTSITFGSSSPSSVIRARDRG
jgi:hypothetical protein